MEENKNFPVRFCGACGKRMVPFFSEGDCNAAGVVVSEWISLKCPQIQAEGFPAFVGNRANGHVVEQILIQVK
jgi:hypothetical protein